MFGENLANIGVNTGLFLVDPKGRGPVAGGALVTSAVIGDDCEAIVGRGSGMELIGKFVDLFGGS